MAATAAQLVLASSSPRRRQLLAEAGVDFTIDPPRLDEPSDRMKHLRPRQMAEALAYFKARDVADRHDGRLVLGADTVVAGPEGIVGKPADADDARRMLSRLSGSRHAVITGVALVGPAARRLIASDVTWVTMRPMSDQELDDYIASGEWEGKAGAYAIQETADRFVTALEGSFSNVVGLPIELVTRMLGRAAPAQENPTC